MMRKVIGLLLVGCVLSSHVKSQDFEAQQARVFTYNVLLGGFIGGVGGVINKDKGEHWLPVLGKNFLKGSLGGAVKYTAKYEAYKIGPSPHRTPYWAIPNRLYYYIGHSMVYNASLNKDLFYAYRAQLYGLNFDLYLQDRVKLKTRISASTLFYFFKESLSGNKLNPVKSLQYGVFYFDMHSDIPLLGYSANNIIVINKNNPYTNVISHELVHTYQVMDYMPIKNFFNKPLKKTFTSVYNSGLYRILSHYIIADPDIFYLAYKYQPDLMFNGRNFYEFEANHFSIRKYRQWP